MLETVRLLIKVMVCYVSIVALVHSSDFSEQNVLRKINKYLQDIVVPEQGIGAREAGSDNETKALTYVEKAFEDLGYSVKRQEFALPNTKNLSGNVIADLNPQHLKTLVIGAHIDSIGTEKGSHGASDNGTGLAVMLTIANQLALNKDLPINVRFIAFGAEEIGKLGSTHYVQMLQQQPAELSRIFAMINLDTIAGGDFLYVHSAHTKPYQCKGLVVNYNSSNEVRTALYRLSQQLSSGLNYIIHPAYQDYPEGVTGDWSDHAPFACAGIPIAYIESTNFNLKGHGGFDGYSQSSHSALWSCFDPEKQSSCNRTTEKGWGHIWHGENDQLTKLNKLFPNRLATQMLLHVKVLTSFINNINKHLPSSKG
ncbi:M28 family metallopeptidase [Thalassotalea ganghwensis]